MEDTLNEAERPEAQGTQDIHELVRKFYRNISLEAMFTVATERYLDKHAAQRPGKHYIARSQRQQSKRRKA